MTGKLTTHILDTMLGKPAGGVRIDLSQSSGNNQDFLKTIHTNADGRTPEAVLEGAGMVPGQYQLLFYIADYHRGIHSPDAGKFLDRVPIVFVITDPAAHYHVPLLVSPWSYSTYRGS